MFSHPHTDHYEDFYPFSAAGILALCLTSCSKYYINTVSSSNMLKDKNTGEFLLENDSVRISYGFGGKDAPLHVKGYNKLSVPLFVDWSRSSMVFNGKAKSFIPDEPKFSATISTHTRNVRTLSSAESNLRDLLKLRSKSLLSLLVRVSKVPFRL